MINSQWLARVKVEVSEAGPPIIRGGTDDPRPHRIRMNVIDLLPDHPAAPKRYRFKALLPQLVFRNSYIVIYLDESLRGNAFQRTSESRDVTVSRVKYEMKVIGHQDKGD